MFLSNSAACREQATLGWAHLVPLLRLLVPKPTDIKNMAAETPQNIYMAKVRFKLHLTFPENLCLDHTVDKNSQYLRQNSLWKS